MEVPVKVTFVGDHAIARMFIRYAKTRMFILEQHMKLFGLDQYSREDVPVEGIHVQSIKTFGHREVIITVAQAVDRQRLIEKVLEYLIIARGTGINIMEGSAEVQHFLLAKAMSAPTGKYTYSFTPIANQIGRAGVHRFLQVRYVHGEKIASLCHYRDLPMGGTSDMIQCVVEVVGESGVPRFIKRVSTSGLAESTLMASLSTTLDTLYVVHSVYNTLDHTTSVNYEKYTIGRDENEKTAWIQSGETNQLDFTASGLYFVDTNIDRDGNICCFRSAEVDTEVYTHTSEGGLFFGFYPITEKTSPVNATETLISGTRTDVSFFTYNVEDNEFIPYTKRLSQTVAPTDGWQSWDYFHAEAVEYTKSSGRFTEDYGRGEAVYCKDFMAVARASTSPYSRMTGGEFARWSIGYIKFETFNGHRVEVDNASEWSNHCSSPGGGSGWKKIASIDKAGSTFFNSIFSCIYLYKNFKQIDIHAEHHSSWSENNVGFYVGDAYTWIKRPEIVSTPHEPPLISLINRKDMLHPFQIENIDRVYNAFISHDEETGLTFAGVQYDDAEHDRQWEIRVFPPEDQNGIDITQQVKDAFYGQFWHNFTTDGVEVPRTDEQKLKDFEVSFDCIYFKRVTRMRQKYVND